MRNDGFVKLSIHPFTFFQIQLFFSEQTRCNIWTTIEFKETNILTQQKLSEEVKSAQTLRIILCAQES